MALLRQWRGRELPPSGSGGPYLLVGDNGWGDTDGPQYVENNLNIQSHAWVEYNPAGATTSKRRRISMGHWWGSATRCYVGWSFPDGPRTVFSFRIGATNGAQWLINGDRTFICATRDTNTVKSWEIRQTVDTSVWQFGWLGLSTAFTGRRPYIRSSGITDKYATTPLGANYQLGGDGYGGALIQFQGWIEGRQSAAGVLTIKYIDTNGVVLGTHSTTIPEANRSVDTLCFGTYDETIANVGCDGGLGENFHDFELWDDAPPDTEWPRGPYVPQAASFSKVVATGPTSADVVTEPLEVVGRVDGTEGQVLGDVGTSVVPLTNWTYRGETVPATIRTNLGVIYKPAVFTEPNQILNIYRPLETEFAPPYRTVMWWHGGFFTQGTPNAIPPNWVQDLVGAGYAVVAPSYPLADPPGFGPTDTNPNKIKHPKQIHWAKRAVWWLKENAATWGIDPDSIITAGHSAGGNLAVQVNVTRGLASDGIGLDNRLGTAFGSLDETWGETDPTVAGSFVYAAPVDWELLIASDPTAGFVIPYTFRGYLGRNNGDMYSNAYDVSPVFNVSATAAPIAYVTGSADILVPGDQMTSLSAACSAASIPFDGYTITAAHENANSAADPLDPTKGIVQWMDDLFGGPPTPV